MKESFYRLDEYKIIESDTGELRWGAHFGMGRLQEGRCFKKGMILFIGPAESDRIGFLKGEFINHLKQFPEWLKTKYYCRGFEVYHCSTGKRLAKEEMQLWMVGRGVDEEGRIFKEKPGQCWDDISTKRATGDIAFMLHKYEIIKKANGQMIWKTHVGPNTVSKGYCIILEDILFIDSRQIEQFTSNRRRFLGNLQQLPKWDQTRYYCPKLSLHDCMTGSGPQEEKKRWPGKEKTTRTHTFGKGDRNRNEFKLKISDLPENRAVDFIRWVWKCIACAAALILLTISLFFNCLTRIWKALKGKWHDKEGKRSSIDHYDD
ncbi:MAG: hypothetical protein P8012_14095 [Desulfobacterales bacterium]